MGSAITSSSVTSSAPKRDAWIEINLQNLRTNLRQLKALLTPKLNILAVIKADAYGHGAEHVATVLKQEGISRFGVATLEEGLAVRQHDQSSEVLVLGAVPKVFWPAAIDAKLTLTFFNEQQLLDAQQLPEGARLKVHLKIDTGMHRLGMDFKMAINWINAALAHPKLQVMGMFTHLACAEVNAVSQQQIDSWGRVLTQLNRSNLELHFANSVGALAYHDTYSNLVRLGLVLYGFYPDLPPSLTRPLPALKPLITLRAKVVALHSLPAGEGVGYGYSFRTKEPSLIATIPLGYADGIPRSLSNRLVAKLGATQVTQVGNIAMDQMMFLVPETTKIGDVITLLDENMTVSQWAQLVGTIPYELLCALRARLDRYYI